MFVRSKLYRVALKSGDSPAIPLVESDEQPTEVRDRWKVIEKMSMITQYAFAGDYTGMYAYLFDFYHKSLFLSRCNFIFVDL